MSSSIKGKVAVVTGASRGIGAATAKMLGRNGASKVVLHYNGFKQGAEQVAKELKGMGCEAELVQANLATDQGIPTRAQRPRGGGIAVARKIGQSRPITEVIEIDRLGTAWRLAEKGQSLAAGKGVDRARFADI